MKGTLTQYVTLGIMLLIIVLLVSFLPSQHVYSATGKVVSHNKVNTLTAMTKEAKVRTD